MATSSHRNAPETFTGHAFVHKDPSLSFTPVDTKRFDPRKNYLGDADLMKKWEGKIVIGTVANINPVKGLETLIYAANSLNDQCPDLAFVVIGPVFKRVRKDTLKSCSNFVKNANFTISNSSGAVQMCVRS